MSVYIRTYNYKLPDSFEEKYISHERDIKGRFGCFDIAKSHPLYPERSDAKIMRVDVIASIIVIIEMLQKMDYSEVVLEEMSLLVANGAFLEEENKHMRRIMKTLQNISEIENQTEKLAHVYRSVPPLTALETLTNSTMSFIAKYTGIKGNNTTYGNTSYGGYAALTKGFDDVLNGNANCALAGGANGSGVYAALAHLNFCDVTEGWTESAACAFIVLQNDATDAVAEITTYQHDKVVPSLFSSNKRRNWKAFFEDRKDTEMVIYSGGFTPDEFNNNKKEVAQIAGQHFSWNDEYGNLGAAAIPMNVVKGIQYIEEGKCNIVDVVDRDVYGRETYLQLSKSK